MADNLFRTGVFSGGAKEELVSFVELNNFIYIPHAKSHVLCNLPLR